MPNAFIGKVALVTGASRGIGKSIAKRFLDEGACVAILDLVRPGLQFSEKGPSEEVRKTLALDCDLRDPSQLERAVSAVVSCFGGIDILINNAGVVHMRAALDYDLQTYEQIMSVNVRGSFLAALACAKPMMVRGGGSIVQIASTCAFPSGASKNLCVYNMSKAAVRQMVASLASEWAPAGVRVNAVAPGNIDAGMTHACLTDASELDSLLRRIPLRRLGTPDDIASACAFLCSSDAQYITGTTLVVDGGWLVR